MAVLIYIEKNAARCKIIENTFRFFFGLFPVLSSFCCCERFYGQLRNQLRFPLGK
jgi:hypothetical protein